jgi:hypothetical protein
LCANLMALVWVVMLQLQTDVCFHQFKASMDCDRCIWLHTDMIFILVCLYIYIYT